MILGDIAKNYHVPDMYAWVTGLIDGEGYLRIIKNPCYSARLSVKMCHRPTVTRLQEIFGVGNVKQAEKARQNCTQSWIWTCSDKIAIYEVLRVIRPYLFTKALEADIVIEFTDPMLNRSKEEKARLRAKLDKVRIRGMTGTSTEVANCQQKNT